MRLPTARLVAALVFMLLFPGPARAEDDDPEAPTLPGLMAQVRAWGDRHPDLVAPLRDRLREMVGGEGGTFDLAEAEASVQEWLEAHAPQIARIRAMGKPGASEEQIIESLELRRSLLLELTEPVIAELEAIEGPVDRLRAMLGSLREPLGEGEAGEDHGTDEAESEGGELRIEIARPEGSSPEAGPTESLPARARRLFQEMKARLGLAP